MLLPIILAFIAVVVIVIVLAIYLEKKRTEALRQTAAALNFDFRPLGDQRLLTELAGFHLFSQGRSRRVSNLMRGTTEELDVSVFDYSYVTGGGKHKHTWRQTVVCFELPGGRLPHFSLRPESVWHKIGAWMGHQDIDFDSHPVFSRRYLLRGQNERAIRRLFDDSVLEHFEGVSGLSVEGSGDRFVVYRQARRAKPDAVHSLLEEGFRVLSLFRPANGDA